MLQQKQKRLSTPQTNCFYLQTYKHTNIHNIQTHVYIECKRLFVCYCEYVVFLLLLLLLLLLQPLSHLSYSAH